MIAPQQRGSRGGVVGVGREAGIVDPGAPAAVAPPQDAPIISTLLSEPMSQQLVQRISGLSCDSSPCYRSELMDCWNIVSYLLDPAPRAVSCSPLKYLQEKYESDVRATVYRSAD